MTGKPEPIAAPPSAEELNRRLEKVRALMLEQNLDYYVSFDPVNVYYLTNFANYIHERPFILVIPKEGTPKMVCPLLETTHVKTRARLPLEYATYYEFPAPKGQNWFDLYRKLIPKDARVGVESAMPFGIAKKTPGKKVLTDIIEEARLIKTDYEIGRTVHACEIINEGHRKLLEITRPGVLVVYIYSEVQRLMMERILADLPDFNVMVTSMSAAVWPPSISHDPHRVPTPFTAMEEGGPHVSGVGGKVDGYGVEIERTFFLGKVPEDAKKPFEVSMAARARAYELAKPGAVLSTIDREVRKVIIKGGYGDNILHRTGHGFGITGHEAPYVALGDNRELVPGMLISIEPGVYVPGKGGFRHSDTILITDTGNIKLTEGPERLEDLTIPI
ncbi:MAG: aminopeptidase P family protein [Candidatus Abyssobacteria bacterium SURF_17]|uniref:Aminopeptidase P family protein n=1 Tax=Candidatus Abyssobacteria bacterium SURF_17 TaxID=2093361 RepID=A0A419FA04_9BACT|nr:MAG: aminopeptidase P family protein [Candidatus Abyssubacteria bacterium SURF_17]